MHARRVLDDALFRAVGRSDLSPYKFDRIDDC